MRAVLRLVAVRDRVGALGEARVLEDIYGRLQQILLASIVAGPAPDWPCGRIDFTSVADFVAESLPLGRTAEGRLVRGCWLRLFCGHRKRMTSECDKRGRS